MWRARPRSAQGPRERRRQRERGARARYEIPLCDDVPRRRMTQNAHHRRADFRTQPSKEPFLGHWGPAIPPCGWCCPRLVGQAECVAPVGVRDVEADALAVEVEACEGDAARVGRPDRILVTWHRIRIGLTEERPTIASI